MKHELKSLEGLRDVHVLKKHVEKSVRLVEGEYMELKPDPSCILMSDALKGRLPELESEMVDQLQGQYVHVIADRHIGTQHLPLTGLLRTVLFDVHPEIEFKVELAEALATVRANELRFEKFELQHGEETTLEMPGPFTVKAARIQEIDPLTQTCVLALQLQRAKKV
jgi:hypothetical protein